MSKSKHLRMVKIENPKEFSRVWNESAKRRWISRGITFSLLLLLATVVLAFADGIWYLFDRRVIPALFLISVFLLFQLGKIGTKEQLKVAREVGYPWE